MLTARVRPESQGLLIDIGTTTTDLIPLDRGQAAARGRTDTERLQRGELVYAGVRRTPVCALATELAYRGIPTGLAAELFASTLDVYLTLDEIESDPKDLSTADGRPATKDAARDRLARMIGTDRDTFSEADALAFAHAADEALLGRLAAAAARACRPTVRVPRFAVVAGSGEFLARRLALRVIELGGTIIGLNQAWGAVASSAGCAYALLVLAAEQNREAGVS
jgi:probable H4MPT-linked C1 transfer pathway protein